MSFLKYYCCAAFPADVILKSKVKTQKCSCLGKEIFKIKGPESSEISLEPVLVNSVKMR